MTKTALKTRASILALGTVALLAACTLAPSYDRPDLPISPSWPQEIVATLPTETQGAAADIAWTEFFRSAGLHYVIGTALENNRDLRIAALNVEEARAISRIQRADLLPSVNAGGGANIQHQSRDLTPAGQDRRSDVYQANIGVTAFELDVFGKIRSLNEAAVQNYLATQEARNAVRIALIAETANAYVQLLAEAKNLVLTEDTLAAQTKSYDLVAKRHESGVASRLDVAQAQTAVEAARVNLSVYQRRVMQMQNALTLLMGVPDGGTSLGSETLDDIRLMDRLPVGLPSGVLLLRPDVRGAEHRLMSANANIGAARAAFFPSITLTGSFGFASDSLGDLFSSGAGGAWGFVPQITMPIFQAGRNVANLDLAEIRKDIGVANYERTVQTAFREVSDELAARQTLTAQLKAQADLVDVTQEAYDLADARYKQGIDSFLNVLDAQRSLYAAQQAYIELERQNLASKINLYKALGGGLTQPAVPSSPVSVAPASTAAPDNAQNDAARPVSLAPNSANAENDVTETVIGAQEADAPPAVEVYTDFDGDIPDGFLVEPAAPAAPRSTSESLGLKPPSSASLNN